MKSSCRSTRSSSRATRRLETSKEELQSLNEELTTTNAQLEGKIAELEATQQRPRQPADQHQHRDALSRHELRIRRFTPAANGLFNLIPSDLGRPSPTSRRNSPTRPLSDAAAVLRDQMPANVEVRAHDGRWYVRQVLRYRTRASRTEGVVVTFSDVAAEALREARRYAESIVDTVREPLLVLDEDARVISANQSFYTAFQVSKEQDRGPHVVRVGPRRVGHPAPADPARRGAPAASTS